MTFTKFRELHPNKDAKAKGYLLLTCDGKFVRANWLGHLRLFESCDGIGRYYSEQDHDLSWAKMPLFMARTLNNAHFE